MTPKPPADSWQVPLPPGPQLGQRQRALGARSLRASFKSHRELNHSNAMELLKYIYLFLRKITKLTNLSPELQKIKSMNQHSNVITGKQRTEAAKARAVSSGVLALTLPAAGTGWAATAGHRGRGGLCPPRRLQGALSGSLAFGSKVAKGVRKKRLGAPERRRRCSVLLAVATSLF